MRQQRRTGQGQVADRVERLVAHELVGVAQALGVDDAVVAERDGVVERGAEREARPSRAARRRA